MKHLPYLKPAKALVLHIRKGAAIREVLPKIDQFDKIRGVQEFARGGIVPTFVAYVG